MSKKNVLNQKLKNDDLQLNLLTNNDLICKDCKYRFYDKRIPCNTTKCSKYFEKPDNVLDGGECNEYEKE